MARKRNKDRFYLPKKLLRMWIVALKSGKYKQGKHKLCIVYDDKTTYCCLGVLAFELGVTDKSYLMSIGIPAWRHRRLTAVDYPEDLKALLTEASAEQIKSNFVGKMTRFNDSGKSFNWISKWLRNNVTGV